MVEKEEKRSTKEVFLTEALKLFARGGYEAVTVSQIAEAVNVSAPALYKHYKNKKELFEAVLELGEKGFAPLPDWRDALGRYLKEAQL